MNEYLLHLGHSLWTPGSLSNDTVDFNSLEHKSTSLVIVQYHVSEDNWINYKTFSHKPSDPLMEVNEMLTGYRESWNQQYSPRFVAQNAKCTQFSFLYIVCVLCTLFSL